MNKKEVKKRVLKDGKPLALNKFSWDEKTNTFSSEEIGLVLDFRCISYCTFKTGSYCTFDTGSCCTFDTGYYCTFDTGSYCTFKTGYNCTFDTGSYCTFDTGSCCTFDTGSYCTFKTGSCCTFDTGSYCTFKTGYNCTFDTGYNCTFKTGYNCTFKTGSCCTFDTNNDAFIVNVEENNVLITRYAFETQKNITDLDVLSKEKMIYFNGNKTPILKDIKDFKLIDGETVIINSTKRFEDYTVYSVMDIKDYFNDVDRKFKIVSKEYNDKTYYAHCEKIEKGIEDVNFKIARQNSSLSDIANNIKEKQNIINWYDYRLITGACEFGTKDWLLRNNYTTDDTMNISEFYAKYKKEKPYGFDKFEEFYKEYFN